MRHHSIWMILGCLAPALLLADSAPRYTASFQSSYDGTHTDLFAQEQDRVRILINQAQMEISSQLGLLQYQEGFQCPLTVRFDDRAAPGVEFALAYVKLVPTVHGIGQELVVNLDVMSQYQSKDFDQIFYHEMTHAVLNDAAVAPYNRALPSWVQEGLAVYISGEGDDRVRNLAQRVRKSQAASLVRDLEEPVLDYARNYLAFKYLYEKQGVNSLQAFVRDLTQGKLPHDAIEDSTGLTWDDFCKNVKEYSADIYRENARPDF